MNCVILIFAACVFTSFSDGSEDYSSRKVLFIQQCKTEQNVGDDVAKIMENKVLPETEQQKCFLECFYTKMGLIKDGKLDHEGAREIARRKYGNDEEKLKKADELFTKCVDVVEAEAMKDKCYHGKAIRGCFISKDNNLLNVFGN